jgi:hypothetical protein
VSSRHALACEECRTLLGGYVLAALEPEEMEAVRAHVAACADCAREHASLAPLPGLLDVAGSTEPVADKPPAALEDAVLDRFARERPRHGSERAGTPGAHAGDVAGVPAADVAGAAGATGAAAEHGAAHHGGRGTRVRGARRARLRTWLSRPVPAAATAAVAAALVTLAASDMLNGSNYSSAHAYGAWLRGSGAAPGARAYAKLTTEAAGTKVDLHVRGVRPAPATSYELWCVGRDGSRVSAGTFRVDETGRAHVHLTTAARVGEYDRLAVERLAEGQPGQRVMAGSIEY